MKRVAYFAFAMLGLIWGSNFIFMKWAGRYVSPSQIVLLRVAFGFVPILLLAVAKRALKWAHFKYIHHYAVMSLLATAVYYFAFAKGTVLLPSSIAGLLSGAIPLFTFICAWLFMSEERINLFGLGLCGTGLAYVIYYFIVEKLGAVAAAGVTYIPPVVALLIGVLLVGDTIHPLGYIAMILILAGVGILQLGSRKPPVAS
jgi:drug/metabolite transporter (DMT)-like permease